jgi:hypothetical protein
VSPAQPQRQYPCEQQSAEESCQCNFLELLSGSGGNSALAISIQNCGTNPLVALPMAVESTGSMEELYGIGHCGFPSSFERTSVEDGDRERSFQHHSARDDTFPPNMKDSERRDAEGIQVLGNLQCCDDGAARNSTQVLEAVTPTSASFNARSQQQLSLHNGTGVYLLPSGGRAVDVPNASSLNASWASLDLTMVPKEDLEWMELHSRERASPGFIAPEPEDPQWCEPHTRMWSALASAQEEYPPS